MQPMSVVRSVRLLILGALVAGLAAAKASTPVDETAMPAAVAAKLARIATPETNADAAARRFLALRQVDGTAAKAGSDVYRFYEAGMARRREMARFASALGRELAADEKALGTWEELGPGNIGGRTRGLVIHPTRPRTMYAAGVSGGVFKTTDGGESWTALTDLLPILTVSALAMDPADPETLYAGTGEGHFREVVRGTGLPLRGAGIFKTTDGGASWRRLPGTGGSTFHWVNDVVVSHGDPRRVYAATRAGVMRSRDGGASWTRILDPQLQGGCFDLALRSDRARDDLLAACGTFTTATVYRKLGAEGDGGWQAVLSEAEMGRTSLAIAPSDQDVVYALAAAHRPGQPGDGGLHAVFRSDAAGAAGTWTAVNRRTDPVKLDTLILSNPVVATIADCGFGGTNGESTLGWYTNVVAVDPLDPDVVFAGGVDLFRSDDGGHSWGLTSYWWSDDSAHADQHVIVFDPRYDGAGNRRMFVGGDGGVYRAADARAPVAIGPQATCSPEASAWRWTSLSRDYGATQFYHGVAYDRGRAYLGGTQDNGTLLGGTTAGTNGWSRILGGDGAYSAVVEGDPPTIYAASQFFGLAKSTDGGATFQGARNGISDAGFLFITPMATDPSDSRRLWTGGRQLWRTDDGAGLWTAASTVLSGSSQVSALGVAPSDSDRVVAGTNDGRILRHDAATAATGATTWAEARPRPGFVSSLHFDPTDADVVWATYAGFGGAHVWRSSDGGATWASRDGGGAGALPDIPVHALVVDPADGGRLYVGTDLGVFVSTDGGARWAVETTGFAAAVTESLAVVEDGARRWLFAFTHGRGAWRVPIAGDGGGDGGGECPWPAGHGHYCRDCGPCSDGEGDCDRDTDCVAGATCTDDVGAAYGFGPGIDVCVGAGGGECPWPAGHGHYCRDCGPCGDGEGDCDRDSDCAAGLACADDVGADFGFGPGIDVCTAGGSCPLPAGAGDYCGQCGPCGHGEGDCDRDTDCAAGLACAQDVGADFGFGPGIDVCVAP